MSDLPASPEIVALERAVGIAGGQAALAKACNVAQPSVWYWLKKAKKAPPEKVLDIERATGVSRHDLRPDLYPRDNGRGA